MLLVRKASFAKVDMQLDDEIHSTAMTAARSQDLEWQVMDHSMFYATSWRSPYHFNCVNQDCAKLDDLRPQSAYCLLSAP